MRLDKPIECEAIIYDTLKWYNKDCPTMPSDTEIVNDEVNIDSDYGENPDIKVFNGFDPQCHLSPRTSNKIGDGRIVKNVNELDSELPSKFGQNRRKISDQKSNELSQPNHNPNKNSTDGNKLTQCSMREERKLSMKS